MCRGGEMKLISLNTWGGKLCEPLIVFVKKAAGTTDIFCFQEVYFSKTPRPDIPWVKADLALELKNALPNFLMVERLAAEGSYVRDETINKDVRTGEAIFIKNPLNIVESGGFHTYSEDRESAKEKIAAITGNFQFAKVKAANETYLIGNIHGIWLPGSKLDTVKRIEQSSRVDAALEKFHGKKVLCGDFNLQPATRSIGMLDADMRDLIKEYKITTTRNRYYADMKKYADYIADYMFVSRDVRVADFKVLPDEVSDHSPLLLEFF